MKRIRKKTKTPTKRLIKIAGKRFGNCTVKEYAYTGASGSYWKCKCDCGKEFVGRSFDLRNGKTRDCGCKRGPPKDESSFNGLYRHYKNGAKARKLEFDLTKEQFKSFTKSICAYCGALSNYKARISNGSRNKEPYIYNGIDRVDNTKGYILGNVTTCCRKCNWMKSDLSYSDFLEHIRKIAIYQDMFPQEEW